MSYFWPAVLGAGILHCLVGLIAAVIAHRKGYSLRRWLAWGLLGGTPSLVLALRLPLRPPSVS
jgi:hypothetical protein